MHYLTPEVLQELLAGKSVNTSLSIKESINARVRKFAKEHGDLDFSKAANQLLAVGLQTVEREEKELTEA